MGGAARHGQEGRHPLCVELTGCWVQWCPRGPFRRGPGRESRKAGQLCLLGPSIQEACGRFLLNELIQTGGGHASPFASVSLHVK